MRNFLILNKIFLTYRSIYILKNMPLSELYVLQNGINVFLLLLYLKIIVFIQLK